MSEEVKWLKRVLEKLIAEAREKGPSQNNSIITFCAARRAIKIFTQGYSEARKEAEKILADLLRHENAIINFLVLCALWDAKNKGVELEIETEIKLEQFVNNQINQGICKKTDAFLKSEKAPYN